MEQKLSDMLSEAKSGSPPPRYSADDVIAAGRRLRHRRRGAWAAVALAVGAALVVPRVVVTDPDPVPIPAAPAADTIAYPAEPFDGNLAGVTVGDWTVSSTTSVTPNYQVAVIIRQVTSGQVIFGQVIVFRSGAFDPSEAEGGWEAVPVNGLPGLYREGKLVWEYADNAWVLVTMAQATREQVAAVAAAVTTGAEQPMRVGVKLGYVPPGFRLASAGESPDRDGQSGLLLVKGDLSYQYQPGETIESNPGRSLPAINVAVQPSSPGQEVGDPVCQTAGSCYRLTDDGRYAVVLSGELSQAELLRMLREATIADITDRGTWFEAADAVG